VREIVIKPKQIPTDEYNNVLISPFRRIGGRVSRQKMEQPELIKAGQLNIIDYYIDKDMFISGGAYWVAPYSVDHVHRDDRVSVSIIDKDDSLGMFILFCGTCGYFRQPQQAGDLCPMCGSNERFVPGVDAIDLGKFVEDEIVMKGSKEGGYFADLASHNGGLAFCTSGLYRRVYYNSFGDIDITLFPKFYLNI